MKLDTNFSQDLPRFSIALVNYKTLELTKITLELLKKHIDSGALPQARVDVWVVDNHSEDASVEYLRSLDWIHLIEREAEGKEEGFVAHGKGLDLILQSINTDYLFLLHTDTFIYDPVVFEWMLSMCRQDANVAAVGCLEQINRGYVRTAWRIVTRFIKHYYRRMKRFLGLRGKDPKPYLEQYIKSFCALWNVALMKQYHYTFLMENRIPGYALQDKMTAHGHKVVTVSPMKLFQFLDHIEAGTVALRKAYEASNRRIKRKKDILIKMEN